MTTPDQPAGDTPMTDHAASYAIILFTRWKSHEISTDELLSSIRDQIEQLGAIERGNADLRGRLLAAESERAEWKRKFNFAYNCKVLAVQQRDTLRAHVRDVLVPALKEAGKLNENLLSMVEDYDGLDWGEDGPPFSPCLDNIEEKMERGLAALAATDKLMEGKP